MPVLINRKICDNAKECNGISVCKTGALSWDEKNKTIIISNEKCINCGLCEKACIVSAIHLAKTKEDYERIKKEIDSDPRKISDLFVDRYGAQPIHPAFLIDEKKFILEVLEYRNIVVCEIFDDNSIMCLLSSIPIKTILENKQVKYRKIMLNTNKIKKDYAIKKLPALLIFKNGLLHGKIEGYYKNEDKEQLKTRVNNIFEEIKQ